MKMSQTLIMTTFATALASAGAIAHGGHPVPPGVPGETHVHVAEYVVGSGPTLLAAVLAGAMLGVALWRQWAARTDKARRGYNGHNS